MTLKFFDLSELDVLDGGRVSVAFAQALARAVADCEDRPGEDKARKILLQMEIVPVKDEEGRCDGVTAAFQVKDNIPTRKSKVYSFGLKAGGRLYYSDENPGNVDQYTFDDVDPESGRVARPMPEEDGSDVA
jgi:hypothetical protein